MLNFLVNKKFIKKAYIIKKIFVIVKQTGRYGGGVRRKWIQNR